MKCEKCGWDDKGTGDFAHVCGPVEIKKQRAMNETLINKLAEQASQKFNRFGERDSWEKLFAELIVRECAHVAVFKDDGMISTADVAGYMAAGRATAAQMIREHFGVEE